jgi:hypothetical protein
MSSPTARTKQQKAPENQSIQTAIRAGKYRYPGKVTPRFIREACELVRNGRPPKVALGALGVKQSAIWNWQHWAETGEKGPKYAQLWSEMAKAWDEWRSFVAGTLPKAVTSDSRMAVEVAARIMPDEYGKRDSVDVNVQIDAGPVLKAIAEAQQRLALQGITEAEWRGDAVEGTEARLPEGVHGPEEV